MDYEFGEIIDFRKDPKVEHFILILGADERRKKILFEVITSRVYKAFPKLCCFFNDYCIVKSCSDFKHHFKDAKEIAAGKKTKIVPVNLTDVFFLDKNNSLGSLSEDSMIVIGGEPESEDESVFAQQKKDGLIKRGGKLSKNDMVRLYTHIKTSEHISPQNLIWIGKSFNILKRTSKD